MEYREIARPAAEAITNNEIGKQNKIFLADIQQAVSINAKRKGYTNILGG